MARSSDKSLHWFKRKMTDTLKVLESWQKWLGHKNTTPVCVTHRMILVYLELNINSITCLTDCVFKVQNYPVAKLQRHIKSDAFWKSLF